MQLIVSRHQAHAKSALVRLGFNIIITVQKVYVSVIVLLPTLLKIKFSLTSANLIIMWFKKVSNKLATFNSCVWFIAF